MSNAERVREEMIVDRYFNFLSDIVVDNDNYSLLLRCLHNIVFYSLVPNDDNRGEDGKQLREIFLDNEDLQGSSYLLEGPCTTLEMLIGLSYRMEHELKYGPCQTSESDCFWLFMRNLNLDWAHNDDYYQKGGNEAVVDCIQLLLDRGYERNGEGGIFPLKRSRKNQRDVEIWYQMQEYLLENYF